MSESTATVLYLPCDVVAVRVRVQIGENLSPLERIALRALAACPCTADELAGLLGLGDRVTLDILHDLWRHDHLMIDFSTRKVDVSQDVRDRIAAGGLDTVAGLDSEEIRRELMIDKLTGHVLPCHGPKAPPMPRLAVDHPRADITLEGAPTSALVAALNQTLSAEERRADADGYDGDDFAQERLVARTGTGRARRVRSILTMPQDLRATSGRRWLPLEVRPAISPDTDRLVVTVTDRRFPAERRDQASQLLTQLADDFPADKFALELRKIAMPGLVDAPPLREAIARLAANAAGTATIPAGQRVNRHRELCADARQLSGLIEEWIADEVTAEVVVGIEHRRLVNELIGQAQRQLIIVCPWIQPEAIGDFEESLRSKIRAGVRVVILWGMAYADKLTGSAANIVNSLGREQSATPMLRPLLSARTHAKVVIADDRAALITSCNVLSSRGGLHEIGVLIRPARGEHSQAVRNLLERVRTIVPDGKMSRQVAIHAQDFDSGTATVTPARLTLPGPPPDDMADDDTQVARAVRAWTSAWTAFAGQIRGRFEARTDIVATPVVDSEHRELLWRAVRTAQRRLVVTSDRLGPDVCDERFREAVHDCLKRGVAVTIVYGRAAEGPDGSHAAHELAALADAHPEKMHLRVGGNHAKVLVWDDETVTGSFNYLSYAGYAIGASYRQRSELSMRLTGADVADRLAAAAGEPRGLALPRPQDAVTARDQGPESLVTGEPAAQYTQAAQRIRNEVLTGSVPGDVIRRVLAESGDPWGVLEALGPDVDDMVRAAAAQCILEYPDRVDPAVPRTWTGRLILERWQAGHFTEAALLRCAHADEAFRPRAWLAVMAAVRGSAECELALIAASDIELLVEERAVLLAVSVAQLLLTGSDYAADVISGLAALNQGAWMDLAKVVLDFAANAPGMLPREMMAANALSGQDEQDRLAAWVALDKALVRSRPIPVENAPGKKTHFALYRPTGILGRLTESAAHRDRAALRSVYSEVLRDGADAAHTAAELVDQTWANVAPNTNPLQGKRRQRYLGRLVDVLDAAGAVLDADQDSQGTHEWARRGDEQQRAAVLALTTGLRGLWPDLRQAVSEVPHPERRLAQSVLADLSVLLHGEEA